MALGVEPGPDGRLRCWWCLGAPEYVDYHDRFWGRPLHGARELFELLVLESFQSGLSWLTILRRREGLPAGLHERGETLDALLWRFAADRDGASPPASGDRLTATTPESEALAQELRRRGFRFVGPTTAYALIQAAGLVNDHLADCAFRQPARIPART